MRKYLLVMAALLAGVAAQAQQTLQSGKTAEFKAVDLSGKLVAKLVRAEEPGFEINLESTDRNRIQWGVTNGTLTVKLRPDAANSQSVAEVTIYYTDLNAIKVNGAEIRTDSTMTAKMLNIDLMSGAKASLALDCKDLNMNITGNSIADLSGSSLYFTLRVVTRSKVDARQMDARSRKKLTFGTMPLRFQSRRRGSVLQPSVLPQCIPPDPDGLR